MKVIIPASFERRKPLLAKVIRRVCKTQIEADRKLAQHIPGYRGTYDPSSREAERGRSKRLHANSAYTHGCAAGGGRYHVASGPARMPVGPTPQLRAIVHDVPEPTPVRTSPKLYPKSYIEGRRTVRMGR